jgi:hypothetical protein
MGDPSQITNTFPLMRRSRCLRKITLSALVSALRRTMVYGYRRDTRKN